MSSRRLQGKSSKSNTGAKEGLNSSIGCLLAALVNMLRGLNLPNSSDKPHTSKGGNESDNEREAYKNDPSMPIPLFELMLIISLQFLGSF